MQPRIAVNQPFLILQTGFPKLEDGSVRGRLQPHAQNLDRQLGALKAEECDEIFSDKVSGKSAANRPGLSKAIDALGMLRSRDPQSSITLSIATSRLTNQEVRHAKNGRNGSSTT